METSLLFRRNSLYWIWILASIAGSSSIVYYSFPSYTLDNYMAIYDDIVTILLFIPSISILVSSITAIVTRSYYFPLKLTLPIVTLAFFISMYIKLVYYYSVVTTVFLIIFGLILGSFHLSLTKILDKKTS